jgi:hypothetical protein
MLYVAEDNVNQMELTHIVVGMQYGFNAKTIVSSFKGIDPGKISETQEKRDVRQGIKHFII